MDWQAFEQKTLGAVPKAAFGLYHPISQSVKEISQFR
jgi:hypothetical protein